jgi:hypothetical protein
MKTNMTNRLGRLMAGTMLPFLFLSCGGPTGQGARESAAADTLWLFNGRDLTGWEFFHREEADPGTVWSVDQGVLCCAGMPFGYARSAEVHADYVLNLEWRWPSEPTNSGVFIHLQEEDAIWPVCYEAQMMHGRAGDLIAMGDSDFLERTDKSRRIVPRLHEESSENPPGEWNTYRIIARGDSLLVYVNGVLENRASGLNYRSGSIGLQSEGGPIEFRNIYLVREPL